MAALLCVLSSVASQAAEPLYQPARSVEFQPLFSILGLKERLFWLRDFTVTAIAPMHSSSGAAALDDSNAVLSQFDAKHQLFKPLGQGLYGERLTNPSKQQDGLQVRSNLLLQYELTRYQTHGDSNDVGLRLGIHLAFR